MHLMRSPNVAEFSRYDQVQCKCLPLKSHTRWCKQVETIGDCYVAVAGLPEPRSDHAIVMARFARDCLNKMNMLTKELETTLGPGE